MKQFLPLFLAVAASAATPKASHFVDSPYASKVPGPTSLTWAPDGSGRLFVTLKAKGVGIVKDGVLQLPLFATFPSLYTGSECGVLGLAFDPDYATNHYVYVFVTVSASEQQIVRFTDVDGVGTDRTTIIGQLPTAGRNHNGGALAFGADGKLYWAIGDNGVKRGVDGDLRTLAAKVGRANPDGTVPDDNPFNDGFGPNNDYIFATGFRNPFTMTFRPGTGDLWLNVVGSNAGGQTFPRTTAGHEQVFVVHAGDDGGYDDYEGNQPASPRFLTPFPRPCIRPAIQYRTGYNGAGVLVRSIVRAVPEPGGGLLVTLAKAHDFRVGQAVVLSLADQYDGGNLVTAVPSATQIIVNLPAGESGEITTGSVDALVQGNCVVGGTFYEGSAFPAEFKGNFFYGDLTGRIMRAELDAAGRPLRITRLLEGASGLTDLAVGPDEALYYSTISGAIRRLAYVAEPDVLVVPASVSLVEGGSAAVSVRLAAPPDGPTPVFVRRREAAEPAHHLSAASGPQAWFTPENWNRPQTVRVTAAPDADTLPETASFAICVPGFRTAVVAAKGTDRNLPQPVVSPSRLVLDEAGTAEFQVSLAEAPTRSVAVTVARATGPANRLRVAENRVVVFTPANWSVPVTVQVAGMQDTNRDPETIDLQCMAAGYRPALVRVSVIDDDSRPPKFVSTAPGRAVVGTPYSYQPEVRALPAPSYSLVAGPSGMTVNPESGAISWTPSTRGDAVITLRATNSLGTADQTFVVAAKANVAPRAALFSPEEGSVLSGTQLDFWGAGLDDYGITRAEFYLDETLVWTDTNSTGQYQFAGGAHQFDSTVYANGPHVFTIRVFDGADLVGEASHTATIQN